ncbi:MAG: flavin reductase [Candidatus Thermoplasmatota archaeon]|nr:flavin reductase [Candidatus Thermoplasmatota archaeon]
MSTTSLTEAYRQFTTGVAFITTHGRRGPNVMAAEWTFNVSYDPFLISVHLGPSKATHAAILETREFGVNMVSEDQITAMGFAGHFSKHNVDKLSSDLFETYPAKRIRAPMIRGCLLNAECRLIQQITMGDHTSLVGEVVEFSIDSSKSPVILHKGARRLGARIERGVELAVAVTPITMAPGSTISITGELTAPERGARDVYVAIVDTKGGEVSHADTKTGNRGYFSLKIPLPQDIGPGAYAVVARYGGAQATARIQLE